MHQFQTSRSRTSTAGRGRSTTYKDKKAIVVVFVGTECPLANLYVPTLIELHKEYADQGRAVPGHQLQQPGHVRPIVSAHAQERDVPFPVLKDFDQKVADAFGAKRTPEVFLLDADRVIRYHGRIDDQYGIGYRREKPTRRDLKSALDELLAGKPITTPKTEAQWLPHQPRRIATRRQVSHLRQARLARSCRSAARSATGRARVGPFSLLTYEDAKRLGRNDPRGRSSNSGCRPGTPTRGTASSSTTAGCRDEERDTLLAWIDQGCPPRATTRTCRRPRSSPRAGRSASRTRSSRWPKEFKVPATGVLSYQHFTVDPGFKEDVWVQAAECRPGNRAVVHHILVYVQAPGTAAVRADGTAATLVGWAPGRHAGDLPDPARPSASPPARSWSSRSTTRPTAPSRPTARRSA